MPFTVDQATAQAQHPEYTFVKPLTPSAQKAAFHVKDLAGNDLCLKIIAPNFSRDRIEREIQALQALDHPNIVRLCEYTFIAKAGSSRHFMVEQFIDGCDLEDKLSTGMPLSRQAASALFASVSDGLEELRTLNIVHRDLKPNNIRVRPDNSPVIIDFGLARLLELPDLTNTAQGAAIGTPTYFAPEQFTGTKHDIDHRTDLFALGVMLHRAVIGTHPFYAVGMSAADLEKAVCTGTDFQNGASFLILPPQWRLLISRLLEKERGARPNTAGQVANMLRKIGNQ